MENKKIKNMISARSVALVGLMTASMTCGKLALSFLPNIEVVTLLCALYGYVFGVYGVVASFLFVLIEPLMYGIGSWIVTYIIYWPTVAAIFMLFKKKNINNRIIFTLTAAALTFAFGIISSVVDSAFLLGINEYYPKNLLIYYIRGIVFYTVHLVSNVVIFLTAYPFLSQKLELVRRSKNL